MRFVWFWTFWHWSKESFRDRSLLLPPLPGIGSHWDEWFHHEAGGEERRAIADAGRTEATQRQFIAWMLRHWSPEADPHGRRLSGRFALGQLAHLPPFAEWSALARYRTGYGLGGVAAVVLAEQSSGMAEDVRAIEALLLPGPAGGPAAGVVAEGFRVDGAELKAPHAAAVSLLAGRGLLTLLAWWLAAGHRPYPRWLGIGLAFGWLAVAALILHLLTGEALEPALPALGGTLLALWIGLVVVASGTAVTVALRAWRAGRRSAAALARSHVRLRMGGGLTVQGGSAGLPFCLNIVLALARAHPEIIRGSWLWRRVLHALGTHAPAWAATGIVTAEGRLRPVVLEPKLRACLAHERIEHLLTPRQRLGPDRGGDQPTTAATPAARAAAETGATTRAAPKASAPTRAPAGARLGFAAEPLRLRRHPRSHVASALLQIARFTSRRQFALNVFALCLSGVMLRALPDLRALLWPAPAPTVVAPSSPSPYQLWVSLDTQDAAHFQAVLESDYWANRRAPVATRDRTTGTVRAEIPLSRLTRQATFDEEHGTIWIERRQRFLHREFAPGARVGRYSLSYLSSLDAHE